MTGTGWLIEAEGGVRLHLFIQPKSSKNEIVGPHDGALKIRLTAPPVDGRANEELISFLAKTLKVPKHAITLLKGETGRRKVVRIEGIGAGAIASLLK